MLFNSLQFAAFFVLTWAVLRALPPRARGPLLLGASLLFYALWVPAYLALLVLTIVVNYGLLRAIAARRHARAALAASVVFTLGLLGGFKYAAFLIASSLPLLRWTLGWEPPLPEIFLPLGISFYSFQMIALAADVKRGHTEAPPSLARYALFVGFFPQLIAGPIVRGHELLPQLEASGETTPERTRRGVWLVGTGLVKKVLLADFLLGPFVDIVFEQPRLDLAPYQLLALYSFSFQIYFDFSGYSDIARGLGLLMGFELPLNFTEPYLSRSPTEFWRRWHMTLSRWLRDYLYIPLGGNRGGQLRTALNVMLTMLLGGLWHGASWSFVAWGGLHGLLLIGHRAVGRGRELAGERLSGAGDWLRAFLLFQAVSLLWVFFRAPTLDVATRYLGSILTGDYLTGWPLLRIAVLLLCVTLHIGERHARLHAAVWQRAVARGFWGPAVEGLVLGTIAALTLLASGGGREFIYFQF
ncbi:MAG: MBOAT family O-acyltransferase [Myxococcota bacterium]